MKHLSSRKRVLPIAVMAAVASTLLYLLLLYYISGYYMYTSYLNTFRIAFGFYPIHPQPILNAIFTVLIATTAGVMTWSWLSRGRFTAGPSCTACIAALLPGMSLCCSPLLLFMATTSSLLTSVFLQSLRELAISVVILQVMMIKVVVDVTQRPETSMGLRAALTRRQNVFLLVLSVAAALAYELYLSLVFPYTF
ncbi:MAG: hypothetical protein ACE5IB_00280 [Candidatus Geothermarchaeales archaeon]